MIGALRKGSTGDQILEILEALVGDSEDQQSPDTYGTLEEQTFWQ